MFNKEKFNNEPVIRLVKKVGFAEAATLLSKYEKRQVTEKEVRINVINIRCQYDFEYYAKNYLFVEDDTIVGNNKIVPFQLNAAQRILLREIEEMKARQVPTRIIHLKPRQYGASTFFEGYIYRDMMFRRNRHATTMSYKDDSATHLRDIAGRFYDRYVMPKPSLKGRSEKNWRFAEYDNTWRVESAEGLSAGHSFTNQILHVSELGRWSGDVESIMRGLTSSVQAHSDTMIIVESTANGFGDYFYKMWQRAKSGDGYKPVFISWFQIEKYKMDFQDNKTWNGLKSKAEFERNLTDYEKWLIDEFGVSLEQLHWRDWKIANDLSGEEDSFKEQYPATDEEAFLQSGRPYFPVTIVREKLVKAQKEDLRRGYLEWTVHGESVDFVEDRAGWWKEQQLGDESKYDNEIVTGSDVAEGKAVSDGNKDPDFSVCTVWNHRLNRVRARFKARVDTDAFEEEIYKASIFYNSSCDAVERNNSMGGAVIKGLKSKENINLFRKETINKVDDVETVEYGWVTDKNSREILLSELRTAMKQGRYTDLDKDFWDECLTFVYDKTGKAQAAQGKHDDVVFSTAIALQAAQQSIPYSQIRATTPKEDTPKDADVIWEQENEVVNPIAEF